jgi:hypothetical protein
MFPQIIDKLTFEKVQERLKTYKIHTGQNYNKDPYILTGKLFCGECGTAMVAGGGTGKTGVKHYYYACKQKVKKQCHKKLENKNDLELKVVNYIISFLQQPENLNIAVADTIKFYEQHTGDNGLKSIETRIANIHKEVEQMTTKFLATDSKLLQASIEKRMKENEILLEDLIVQKARIELERGLKITKEQIIDFVRNLLKDDPNDKEYQKQLIDNLIYKVFVYDSERSEISGANATDDGFITGFFNFRVNESDLDITLDNNTQIIDNIKSNNGVQIHSPLLHQGK